MSIGVTMLLEPRIEPGLLEQAVRHSPFVAEGQDSASQGNFVHLPGERRCVVFWGSMCRCRERGKREHISALVRAIWHKAKPQEKGIHVVLSGSVGAPSLCLVLPLLCHEDLVPLGIPAACCSFRLGSWWRLKHKILALLQQSPSCIAQPVFPLRCYRALPALLRALPW